MAIVYNNSTRALALRSLSLYCSGRGRGELGRSRGFRLGLPSTYYILHDSCYQMPSLQHHDPPAAIYTYNLPTLPPFTLTASYNTSPPLPALHHHSRPPHRYTKPLRNPRSASHRYSSRNKVSILRPQQTVSPRPQPNRPNRIIALRQNQRSLPRPGLANQARVVRSGAGAGTTTRAAETRRSKRRKL